MKKVILIMFILLLIPIQTYAASYGNLYYVPYMDQYRLDYSYNTADTHYDLVFTAADGTTYTGTYNFAPTGIHYLTCNGTYNMNFYDAAGSVLHTAGPMVTTAIVAPTCNSYPVGVSGKNDLNARQSGNDIIWDANPSATNYEIWKDGTKVSDTPGTTYTPTGDGGFSIVGKDASGAIVGQSDLNFKATTPPTTPPPFDPNCPECVSLRNTLQCPEWDTYMGELTKAIKNALPAPPDWDHIADLIGKSTIDHLQTYNGPVPTAPTQTEIDSKLNTELPEVDASVPNADKLVPEMPPGYEQPKPFDITSGPQIEIKDESQAFQIFDPLNNITHDDPGVPVIPGDPKNNNGGIQQPAATSFPMATPKPLPSELPNNPVPVPSSPPGSAPAPAPNTNPGTGPIPVWKGD
jgi:hypothetical protein